MSLSLYGQSQGRRWRRAAQPSALATESADAQVGLHRGSAVVQTDANGGSLQVNRYTACPACCARGCWAALRKGETRYRFTGQPEEASLGLYDYGARWLNLSPLLK